MNYGHMKMNKRKRAAQEIKKHFPYTSGPYVDVPNALYMDHDHPMQGYHEAIKPHWNALVDQLEKGGYSSLVRLLDRLASHRERVKKQVKRQEEKLNRYKLLSYICRHDGEKYGYDKTLGETLGFPPLDLPGETWVWAGIAGGWVVDKKTHIEDFDLYPHVSDTLLERFSADRLPHHPNLFSQRMTWREVVTEVGEYGKQENEAFDNFNGVLSVLRFRASVAEAVLWQYEALGYAEPFPEYSNHRESQSLKDAKARKMIEYGLSLYDANRESYSNRSSLTQKIADHFKMGEARYVQSYLAEKRLYVTQEGPGRPNREKEKRLFEDTITLWREWLDDEIDGNGQMDNNG